MGREEEIGSRERREEKAFCYCIKIINDDDDNCIRLPRCPFMPTTQRQLRKETVTHRSKKHIAIGD